MSESKLKRIRAEETLLSFAGVQTPSGKIQDHWETSSASTPMCQLAYLFKLKRTKNVKSIIERLFPLIAAK